MCGRSSLHDAPVGILEKFSLPTVLPGFVPRYNIAPTQQQWTLALDPDGNPAVTPRRWGLIPSWASDPSIGNRMINARADTLAEKPAFRDALRDRRCLILADGYYEWTGTGKSRVPVFFHMKGHEPFVMAGLWETWGSGDQMVETCTVITTDASQQVSRFHHRMPALLTIDQAMTWLDQSTSIRTALSLLAPCESSDLESHEVSKLVNSPANDTRECIEPV